MEEEIEKKEKEEREREMIKLKLEKRRHMKDETVNFVLAKLLPQTWKREATKQSLDLIHDAQFDRQYEAMCQANGVPCQ